MVSVTGLASGIGSYMFLIDSLIFLLLHSIKKTSNDICMAIRIWQRWLATRAHGHGIRIGGASCTPFFIGYVPIRSLLCDKPIIKSAFGNLLSFIKRTFFASKIFEVFFPHVILYNFFINLIYF